MIGNNSCGVHGLLGGKVVDNVESLDIVLYDGTRMTVGATPPEQLERIIRAGGRVGQIYAGLARIRDRYAALVREKFPRIPRRVSGYNLDELLPENDFHVARALVGSEGTCANVVSATLNLTASPPFRVLTVLASAMRFSPPMPFRWRSNTSPSASKASIICSSISCAAKVSRSSDLDQLPPGVGFLLVEMGAWTAEEAQAKAEARRPRRRNPGPTRQSRTSARRKKRVSVWHVRESALGAMVFVPGEPDRWEGWEDAAVPPAQLGNYLRAHHRADGRVRLSQPALRPLWPGLRAHAHQLRFLAPQKGLRQIPRVHRSRRRCCDFASADRSAASTATARPARRCCPRCSVRS